MLGRWWSWWCVAVAACALVVAVGCGDAAPTTWYARDGSVVVGVFDCPDDTAARNLLRDWLAAPPPADATPSSAVETHDLASLLPGDGVVGRWATTGPPRTASGDALPVLLAENAAQYAAFGVRQTAWAEYANPALGGRAMLRIDIFDMGTPENAFGLYSQRRVPEGKIRGIGAEASVGPRDVLAWVDRFVYTVTIYNYSTDTASALIDFAERMGRDIVGVETAPSLVAEASSRHLMPFSHRWFRTAGQRATASRREALSRFALPAGSRGFLAKAAVRDGFAEAFYVAFPTDRAAAEAFAALRDSAGPGSHVSDAGIGSESARVRRAP